MREDLNKLLCERERPQSDDCFHFYRHGKKWAIPTSFDPEELEDAFCGVGNGYREAMKCRHNSKNFNENLNPLWGFVHKSVGKKWDDVYGEICQVFDKRSVINQHILIHLFQKVEIKDIYADAKGQLIYQPVSSYRWTRAVPLKESHVEYYVDPRDGVLKYNTGHMTWNQERRQRAEEQAKEQAKIHRVIDKATELHKIDGHWFEVKYQDVSGERVTTVTSGPYLKNYVRTSTIYPVNFDVVKKCTVTDPRFAKTKRQLSHKELKKHKLI